MKLYNNSRRYWEDVLLPRGHLVRSFFPSKVLPLALVTYAEDLITDIHTFGPESSICGQKLNIWKETWEKYEDTQSDYQ